MAEARPARAAPENRGRETWARPTAEARPAENNNGRHFYPQAAAEETPALTVADEKPKEGVQTENNDPINLKVAGRDGSVVQFKIQRHTPLSKLMKAYCERQGLPMRLIKFLVDRQPISKTDTPASLEMAAEDTIDVFQQQAGGVY
ncbi:small ubiquitin-related modifier 2-like [Aotus nancymaae]|uniref:small ubiquitin-related modifier 2-like n=1 Tax=Aotus nancymaae TaxID=37293 RepID=UPI0030FED123